MKLSWYAVRMTKIVTIIIIVSTVWSVISGIIEKHKKDKLAAQRKLGLKTGQNQPQIPQVTSADLFDARINALRKRPPASVPVSPQVVVEKTPKRRNKKSPIHRIKPLHEEDCPLPPLTPKKRIQSRAKAVSRLLKTPQNLRTAIILSEVLSKPISQR
jgi:hypothetical protein